MYRWDADRPIERGKYGEMGAHCNVKGHPTVSCAKTAEPNEMPFWMKTRVGPINQTALKEGLDPHGKEHI